MKKATTFFSIKKLSLDDKNSIIQMIENDEYIKAKKYFDLLDKRIPIGFIVEDRQFEFFNNKFKYYEPTVESICSFLKNEDRIITDENGITYTFDEFWNIVESHKNDKTILNSIENMAESQREMYDIDCCINFRNNEKLKQYNPKYGVFFNDGLYFNAIT